MSARTTLRGIVSAAALLLVVGPPLAGQRSALERVEELTRMGRPDEARVALQAWWDSGRADATRRDLQRGLWLRARLTVDPVQAELDFQRLIVLYPRGPFTAQAIFRLAQSAHAMGDGEAARGYVDTLVRDYRNNPVREDAEAWLASAGPPPPPLDAPERAPDAEADQPRGDPVADTAAAVGDPPAEDEPAEAGPTADAGNYYVQLGAFAEEARALAVHEQVTEMGIDVRVVRVEGSRFFHVRFGRFVERADAVEELERLTEAGVAAALVRDERPEEPVRG